MRSIAVPANLAPGNGALVAAGVASAKGSLEAGSLAFSYDTKLRRRDVEVQPLIRSNNIPVELSGIYICAIITT